MKTSRHWRKFLLLSFVGVVALTMLSISQLEEYVRQSFVFWIYMITPVAAYVGGGVFVWSGVHLMRFNDSLIGTKFQLTWFLRLIAVGGCFLLLIDVVQLLDMQSGYMPVIFAFGSGILWVACFFMTRMGEP